MEIGLADHIKTYVEIEERWKQIHAASYESPAEHEYGGLDVTWKAESREPVTHWADALNMEPSEFRKYIGKHKSFEVEFDDALIADIEVKMADDDDVLIYCSKVYGVEGEEYTP